MRYKDKFIKTVVSKGWVVGEGNGGLFLMGTDEKVLDIDNGDGYITMNVLNAT